MQYLTVQDVLWIHLQIAKKTVKFNYAKLEEAVSYQYAYGKSKDVVSQAARFFTGFPKMSPFDSDNQAAAFVAGISFLALNGLHVEVGDKEIGEWFNRVSMKAEAKLAIETGTKKDEHAHAATAREVATQVLNAYEKTIREFAA